MWCNSSSDRGRVLEFYYIVQDTKPDIFGQSPAALSNYLICSLQRLHRLFYIYLLRFISSYRIDGTEWIQRGVLCNASKVPSAKGRAKMQIYNVGYSFDDFSEDRTREPLYPGGRKLLQLMDGHLRSARLRNCYCRDRTGG